jgi:hypothetical protein
MLLSSFTRNRSKSQRQEGNNPSSSFTNSSHIIHSANHSNSQTQEQDDNHSLISSFSGISSDETDVDPEHKPSTTGGDDDDDEDDDDSEMETDMHIRRKRELTEDQNVMIMSLVKLKPTTEKVNITKRNREME